MIAQITKTVSSMGINIENMVNASKKGFKTSYTMLELLHQPDDSILDRINAIPGIVRSRLIPEAK